MHRIYVVRHLVTGRRYVGQTQFSVDHRWKQHCKAARCGSPYHLHRAIKLHGADQFVVVEVMRDLTKTEADYHERRLIALFGTRSHGGGGFNMTDGGDGVWDESKWVDTRDELFAWARGHNGAWPRSVTQPRAQDTPAEAIQRRLASWMHTQRGIGRANMSTARVQLLEEDEDARQPWSWNLQQEVWNDTRNELFAWARGHNGAWPRHVGQPRAQDTPAEAVQRRLAQWMHNQRKVGRTNMPTLRVEMLEEEEDGRQPWSWDPLEQTWNDTRNELFAWARGHNGGWPRPVPQPRTQDTPAEAVQRRLASWMTKQRGIGRANMSTARVQLLEEDEDGRQPWSWDPRDALWNDTRNELFAWARGHNGAWPRQVEQPSAQDTPAESVQRRLATWMTTQRQIGRAHMSTSRVEMLEEEEDGRQPWSWGTRREEVWVDTRNELFAWARGHNGAWPRRVEQPSAQDTPAESVQRRLAQWMSKQRKVGRANMSTARVEMLEEEEDGRDNWSWGTRRVRRRLS